MAKKAVNSSYRLHRGSGQAVVTLQGRTYYLGRYGSPESKEKFHRLVAESIVSPTFGTSKSRVTIAEATVKYLEYCDEYYSEKERVVLHHALKPLIERFASLPLQEFGVVQFKVIRQHWIKKDCSRQYVNSQMKRIVRFAKWTVSEALADPSLHHALKCVEPLKRGRCDVREAEPVKPVSDEDIEKTLPYLPPILQDMVRLHQVLGCRPGEIVKITPAMIDTSKAVWSIRLEEHKTAWRGHERVIYVGPKAQAILKPYLSGHRDRVIFSPKVAVEQRLQKKEAERKTALSCGNRRGTNRATAPRKTAGDSYDTQSYGKAIKYACLQAEIPVWSPNQLRHSAATKLRDLEGIESASVILGHKCLDVTQVYAEKSARKAMEVAKRHG
jgi:integrase